MPRLTDRRTKVRLLWLTGAGLVTPVFFMAIDLLGLSTAERLHELSVYLWPTQLQMMAASGYPQNHPWFWQVFAMSTALNVLLYIIVGFLFFWVVIDLFWGKLLKRKLSPNETTVA